MKRKIYNFFSIIISIAFLLLMAAIIVAVMKTSIETGLFFRILAGAVFCVIPAIFFVGCGSALWDFIVNELL